MSYCSPKFTGFNPTTFSPSAVMDAGIRIAKARGRAYTAEMPFPCTCGDPSHEFVATPNGWERTDVPKPPAPDRVLYWTCFDCDYRNPESAENCQVCNYPDNILN